MAYINLATATNKKFAAAAINDVQMYTTTSTPSFFIGASNSKNYIQVSPTVTTLSNIQVTGTSVSSNATVSNLVITGGIFNKLPDGTLSQYTMASGGGSGGGGSATVSSNLVLESLTTATTNTSLLNVNGEIVIRGGPPQSNISLASGTFGDILGSNITASKNLTVSTGGTVSLPSGSLNGICLNSNSSATLNSLTLSNLVLQTSNITLPSGSLPFTAVDTNSIPASSISWNAIDKQSVYAIDWNMIDQSTVPSFTTSIPSNLVLDTVVANTSTAKEFILTAGGGSSSPAPSSINWSSIDISTVSVPFNKVTAVNNAFTFNANVLVPSSRIGVKNPSPSCEIDVTGTIKATTVVNSSDIRVKKDITPFSLSSSAIASLNPVTFSYIDDPSKTRLGFIAQEVESVFPMAVETMPGFVPAGETDVVVGDVVKLDSGKVVTVRGIAPLVLEPAESGAIVQKQVPDFKSINYASLITCVIAALKAGSS